MEDDKDGVVEHEDSLAGTEQERMPAPRYWNAEGLRRLVTAPNRVYVSIF